MDNCVCGMKHSSGMPAADSSECPGQVLAMAYVPWQHLDTVYDPEDGFSRGTIFPELDKPWMVGGGGSCGR